MQRGRLRGTYSAAVTVTLSATDNPGGSGVAGIYYTTDGSTPSTSNGTLYLSGFLVSATATVKYRAFDVAGNAEAVNSQPITIDTGSGDTTAPTSTIECNGAACAGTYSAAVSVTLSASDNPGGSGVATIRYTTDGIDPAASNGSSTRARSASRRRPRSSTAPTTAGNAEAANSQPITIDTGSGDTTAPTSTIACNGAACAGTYSAAVTVTLSASDNPGGSGDLPDPLHHRRHDSDGDDRQRLFGRVHGLDLVDGEVLGRRCRR